jgi:hypothetical protein
MQAVAVGPATNTQMDLYLGPGALEAVAPGLAPAMVLAWPVLQILAAVAVAVAIQQV